MSASSLLHNKVSSCITEKSWWLYFLESPSLHGEPRFLLCKKVNTAVTLMRLSKNPISLNLNWKYPYDLRMYYDTHIHTFSNVSTEETYELWPRQGQRVALLHKLWPPNIISYWKELILLREIADSRLRAESEQDEDTTSCHHYQVRKVLSVLSKEPRSQLKKAPLGEELDNFGHQ